MIEFNLKEFIVEAKINTGVGYSIIMEYQCSSKLFAKLLYNQLKDKQWRVMESFAKKNYEEGFDDHKKRKPKRNWHPSNIN